MNSAPRTYRGVNIWPNTQPGYALRYTARLASGDQVAADTLEGIKRRIREGLALS